MTIKNSFLIVFILFFSMMNSSVLSAQMSDILIELSKKDQVQLMGEKVVLSEISTLINKRIDKLPEDEQQVQSVTITLGVAITDDFLDLVKDEVRKTPVRFLNVQRSIISTYNQNNPITDQMIEQYNTLIKGWNEKQEHERFYRQIELDFVEGVSKRMNLQQQLRTEKLPGYLPFVKKPEPVSPVEMQDFERWKFDDSYRLFVNLKLVDKAFLNDKKPVYFESYYVFRKLENEKPITEVYLVEEDLGVFEK